MSDDLAKRAVACKGWRWMPGMLTVDGWRVVDAYEDGTVRWVSDCGQMETRTPFGGKLKSTPDISDPCTLGGLLALVREAWGDTLVHVRPLVNGRTGAAAGEWHCFVGDGVDLRIYKGATEAEALVAALEAAVAKEVSDE